ncbi:TIGR04255 family protein [bacterium]|nr:TIGR04255 family protein [bacterium]
MTWKIKKYNHQTFSRNTIKSTIIQLRFQPILKIADRISDFQEIVRKRFPSFEEGMVRTINQMRTDSIEIKEERQFRLGTLDGKTLIGLGPAAIYLESHWHESRQELFNDVNIAIDALQKVYSPIVPSRLGMRYINEIDKGKISKDFGRALEWKDLIDKEYLKGPISLASLNATLFSHEIRSKVNGGMLTLRYGLVGDIDNPTFSFDIDRYFEGNFEFGTLDARMHAFADDIFSSYMTIVGDSLKEWLTKSNGEK